MEILKTCEWMTQESSVIVSDKFKILGIAKNLTDRMTTENTRLSSLNSFPQMYYKYCSLRFIILNKHFPIIIFNCLPYNIQANTGMPCFSIRKPSSNILCLYSSGMPMP